MGQIERILVLGAGPGGIAAAAALARRSFEVALYNRSSSRLEPLIERGGVEIEGDLGEAFIPIPTITTDIAEATQHDPQLILIAVPAYGQRAMVEALLSHLKAGQTILLLTGSAGTLEVAPLIKEAGHNLDELLLGETVTLPQSARIVEAAKIRIKLPSTIRTAAFPGRNTQRLVERVGDTLKLLPKPNVLDPALNNPNFMIHPGPMLLNYATVERAEGVFSIMNEGMTPGVLRLLDAIDEEKMALQRALGLDVVLIDDLYRETGSGPHVYRSSGEPFGIQERSGDSFKDRIWSRYIEEDVPYGTVLYSSLGKMLGVPTPASDSTNTILSIVEEKDYYAEGRTLENLGLAALGKEGLLRYLETGEEA